MLAAVARQERDGDGGRDEPGEERREEAGPPARSGLPFRRRALARRFGAKVLLLANDLAGEELELPARLQAELGVETGARRLIERECLGLAAGPVQRDHQLRDEALSIGVRVDVCPELADELAVATEGELRLDALLDGDEAQLLEALDLGLPPVVQADVRQGLPRQRPSASWASSAVRAWSPEAEAVDASASRAVKTRVSSSPLSTTAR